MKSGVDKSSLAGVLLAMAGIVGGMMLEGGRLSQILQPTAGLIVVGGTLGAVMLAFPLDVVLTALKRIARVFLHHEPDHDEMINQLIGFLNLARRDGILSLDTKVATIQNPFLKRALMLAVDGTEPQELLKLMELQMDHEVDREEEVARVFESAGGYSPTVGIIGAVIGLIQVMQHLDNIEEVGRGIAVAFVATIYGVALANLLFLPAAGKLKIRIRQQQIQREMMLEGVLGIMEGMNPRLLQTKLSAFFGETHPGVPRADNTGMRRVA